MGLLGSRPCFLVEHISEKELSRRGIVWKQNCQESELSKNRIGRKQNCQETELAIVVQFKPHYYLHHYRIVKERDYCGDEAQ